MKITFLRIYVFAVLASLLLAPAVSAQTATAQEAMTLSWDIPTTRVNGNPLPVTSIANYEIYYTVDGGTETMVSVTPGSTKTRVINFTLAPKATPYALRFYIAAVDTAGLKSERSAPLNTTLLVRDALPSPVTNVKVSVICTNVSCALTVQ